MEEFRSEMEAFRKDAEAESEYYKEPHIRTERLTALYRKFDASERAMANEVLCEWALSQNELIRFDALVLIDDLQIERALPTLQELTRQLASSPAPGAPYEIKRVNRIIESLADNHTERPPSS